MTDRAFWDVLNVEAEKNWSEEISDMIMRL